MTFLIVLTRGWKKHLPNNITTPRCHKYSVLGCQDILFNPHAENAKIDLLCGLVYKLFINFQALKQKLHANWPGTATFVFLWPVARQPRPKLAATQLRPPVDMLLMWWELSETFSALRKFILDQLLFNGSRHLLRIWHTGTKQGVNSCGVCQIGTYLSQYEFL